MSTLTDRPCKLGLSLNIRTEQHGDERVPACDIPLVGILLEKHEVDELIGDGYWKSIFKPTGESNVPRSAFPTISGHSVDGKYEGSVTIVLGPNIQDIELEGITIAKIYLEPLEGGLVSMQCSVQTSEAVEKFTGKLTARLDTEINVEIEFGDKVERARSKQQDLPINTFGDGDKPETKAKARKPRNISRLSH